MLDKNLMKMLGKDKSLVFLITFLEVVGTLANITVSYCICMSLYQLSIGMNDINQYVILIIAAVLSVIVSAVIVIVSGRLRNNLGSKVKKRLREESYNKLLELGLSDSHQANASLTQLIIEGVEQIDTYYSRYLPDFFYAMITPLILFVICLLINYKVGLTLIICLPLIPISIVFVSKYAKKIFAQYWDKYINVGNVFLDNLEGMKELKIYNADGLKQIESAVK